MNDQCPVCKSSYAKILPEAARFCAASGRRERK